MKSAVQDGCGSNFKIIALLIVAMALVFYSSLGIGQQKSSIDLQEKPDTAGAAVNYEYFEGVWNRLPDFDKLSPVKTGAYPSVSLDAAARSDNFGFRFTTLLSLEKSGEYKFYVTSDDGSALYIDGAKVVDNNGLHPSTEKSGSMYLEAGLHPVSVLYFEKNGAQALMVEIDSPYFDRQNITPFLQSPLLIFTEAESGRLTDSQIPSVAKVNSNVADGIASVEDTDTESVPGASATKTDSAGSTARNSNLKNDSEAVDNGVENIPLDDTEIEREEPLQPQFVGSDNDTAEQGFVPDVVDSAGAIDTEVGLISGAVIQDNSSIDSIAGKSDPGAELASVDNAVEASQPEDSISKREEPVRPGLFEIDEDAAERALERSLVLLDALLLSPGKVDLGLDFSYGVDNRTEPILLVVTDEQSDTDSDAVGVSEVMDRRAGAVLDLRFGLPLDSQINISAPFFNTDTDTNIRLAGSSVESQSNSDSQSGPFSVGIVKTLVKEKGRIPDLIASATYSDGGSGNGASDFTLGITATKRQDPLIFTANASISRSEEVGAVRAGDRTSLSIGTVLAASPSTSLLFTFDQLFISDVTIDDSPVDGSKLEIARATIGASSVVSRNLFLNSTLEFGLSETAQDYMFTLGMSKRLSIW